MGFEKTARQFDIDDPQSANYSRIGADGQCALIRFIHRIIGIGISSGLK